MGGSRVISRVSHRAFDSIANQLCSLAGFATLFPMANTLREGRAINAPKARARKLVLVALATALVTVATFFFQIYIPVTRGYFNIGEAAIYIIAFLYGPYVGSFAGGVGSMLSDILGGYWFYAPGTLIIKSIEGGVLGLLATRRPRLSRRSWIAVSLSLSLALFLAIYIIGTTYFAGVTTISSFSFDIPAIFWLIVALLASSVIALTSFYMSPEASWLVISAAVAGSLMVLGYFLYEQFVLGYVAAAEVPFNVGQVLVGIIIAVPAYKSLKSLQKLQRTDA